MSEPDLIACYLAELRRSLGDRPDLEDEVAEVEDHLRETTHRWELEGVGPDAAQRRTIDRFGESTLVARAYAVGDKGGIVMPSALTRTAGAVALLTAVLWCLAAAARWWETQLERGWESERFVIFSGLQAAAVLGTTVVMVGMVVRIGRRDLAALVAVLGGIGVLVYGATAWMWPVWGLFISGGFLLVLIRWRALAGQVNRSYWALVAAWPAALIVVVALSIAEVGAIDEWGEFPLASTLGLVVGAALSAVGMVSVGTRLISEKSARSVRDLVQA